MSTIIELLICLGALNFTITGIESYVKICNIQRESVLRLYLNAFSAICSILLFFLYLNSFLNEMDNKKEVKTIKDSVQIDTVPFRKVKATYYNPTSGQCDKTPLITGSGYKINLKKLKNKDIKVVAVSRDLLKIYPYGSTIYVHQPVHLRGTYKVEDTMNKRFTNRIDFLVYDKVKVDSVHISI
jgi:3D (Asp-Asp-Asp) domain-containing protein